jgi:hypothetical protein
MVEPKRRLSLSPHPHRARDPAWWRRRAGWAALLGALLLHGMTFEWLGPLFDTPPRPAPSMQRLQATYTRQLAAAEPPAEAAPAAPRTAARRSAARPGAAQARRLSPSELDAERAERLARAREQLQAAQLSTPVPSDPAASAPPPAPETAAAVPAQGVATAASAAAEEASPPSAAASDPAPTALASGGSGDGPLLGEGRPWPASTRLRYAMNGWYNGEVLGQAQVEFLRQGWRYQVHLDVTIGPGFAPLATRRMSSEGRIDGQGLVPSRFDQLTWQVIGRSRSARLEFDDQGITLQRGQRVPPAPGVQDSASQFIQMVYLLTTRPELREPGRSIEFPLALPHRVDRWAYDVVASEKLDTPLGPQPTVHVKPRRAASPDALSVEIWYAPQLQWLPVRIFIRQDANTWMDLKLDRPPEQSAS